MFDSLKCLRWSWDPTLHTVAQRTALPLCGKAKLTEHSLCLGPQTCSAAEETWSPAAPAHPSPAPGLQNWSTWWGHFSPFWSALRRFRLWKPTEKLYDGNESEFQLFADCLFRYLLWRNSPPSPNASIII